MDSSQHSPLRIIPHLGQVSDHTSKPARSEDWGVFHEHVARSHLANDSCHFSPQSTSSAFDPFAASSGADVLAREAASDDVHHSTPRLSVEGSDVVPDRERRERSVVLAGAEDAAGVVVDFDGADRSPSEEFAPEYAASSACE